MKSFFLYASLLTLSSIVISASCNDKKEIQFVLNFDPWDAGGMKVKEEKFVRMIPGTNFFQVISTIITDSNKDLIVGIELTTFGNSHIIKNKEKGLLSSWEKINSIYGSLGTAVYVDPKYLEGFTKSTNDEYILMKVKPNEPFCYYVRAGWDGNHLFKSASEWESLVINITG